jgi:Thioredoxin domain-containing protein
LAEVLDITEHEELLDLLDTEQRVVVKFTAPAWCVPCQRFAPHFKTAAAKSDATFVAVDVDNAHWAMVEYGVQGVPTVVLFENGERVRDLKERTALKLLTELD